MSRTSPFARVRAAESVGRIDRGRRRFNLGASSTFIALAARSARARALEDVNSARDAPWLPQRDPSSGHITEEAWASLPLRRWVEIEGSSAIPSLHRQLVESGYTDANPLITEATLEKHLRGSFAAWIGGCVDPASHSFYVPYGGGHSDGALNGIWKLDLQCMTWHIEKMPSHPAARGAQWSAAYLDRSGRGGGGNYTIYRTELADPRRWTGYSVRDDGYCDVLPDLRPTSRHQYMGVVFDSNRKRIYTHRYRRLSYSTMHRSESDFLYDPAVLPWPKTGRPNADPDNHAIFDSSTDATYLWGIGGSYWSFFRLDEHQGTLLRLPPLPSHLNRIATMTQVGRELYFLNLGSNNNNSRAPVVSQRLDVFDLDRQKWIRADTVDGYPKRMDPVGGEVWATNVSDDMQSMVWIPEKRKFACYFSIPDVWCWLDPERLVISPFQNSGSVAPGVHVGSKTFYYGQRKSLVYAPGVDRKGRNCSVFLMRLD